MVGSNLNVRQKEAVLTFFDIDNPDILFIELDDLSGRRVGDVDYDALLDKVEAITPVPGGVGPMTIAMLLVNTITAARLSIHGKG